jgi:hypothetical protein
MVSKGLHCLTKNLPQQLAQLGAVRNSWLDSLLRKLAGAMIHGSFHLAIAPSTFPGGGLVFSACLVGGYGFVAVDSVRGNGYAREPGQAQTGINSSAIPDSPNAAEIRNILLYVWVLSNRDFQEKEASPVGFARGMALG